MRLSRSASSSWLCQTFGLERRPLISEVPLYLCPALRSRALPAPAAAAAGQRRNFGTPARHHDSNNGPRRPVQTRSIHAHAQAQAETQAQAQTQTSATTDADSTDAETSAPAQSLPLQCSGCGALSQTSRPNAAGYFDLNRRAVRQYLGLIPDEKRMRGDDRALQDALGAIDLEKMDQLGVDLRTLVPEPGSTSSRGGGRRPGGNPDGDNNPSASAPLCDRCHALVHHHSGTPIFHPSVESLRETIEESPHRNNHIYHVLDAADFPLSLLPKLGTLLLGITPLRSRNRRARAPGDNHHHHYRDGRRTELSFIITRSDLLAPQKAQVDALMPYLRETLRDALGRLGRNVRLGNVRCVSAKRSWWTKELKEEIWERGAAGWMVGKANVGKSQLFEAVFPKGRMDWKAKAKAGQHDVSVSVFPRSQPQDAVAVINKQQQQQLLEDESSLLLLPPARPETNYPTMPVVSSLPGTTASPIRVPFGNGKGELIDLPGLPRSDLELYVREEHRASLLMRSRVVPEQQTLKPGQSLLLGGLIRITPRTPDLVFLAYSFVPLALAPHLTATTKAIAIQEQQEIVDDDGAVTVPIPRVETVALALPTTTIKHAGGFALRWDVTKRRAGPITRKDAVNIKVERLPFRVLAVDILIEGCGWVEVVAQVRARTLSSGGSSSAAVMEKKKKDVKKDVKKKKTSSKLVQAEDFSLDDPEEHARDQDEAREDRDMKESDPDDEPNWPVVDVFSPEGKFIGSRRPMNAWLLNKPKRTGGPTMRPRRSMKGAKKEAKRVRRAEGGDGGEGGNVNVNVS